MKARETLEVYIPLASRLGMFQMRTELEDLQLVLRARNGDGAALDVLIRRYTGFVRLKASSYFLAGGDSLERYVALNTVGFPVTLNRLGRAGWELVSALDTNDVRGQTRMVVCILKRPVQV